MPLHLLVKWGRWFLQIVDIHVGNFNMMLTGRWFPQIVDYKGQWESISNIYITKIVVLVSEPVRRRSRATELPCFYIVCTCNIFTRLSIAEKVRLFSEIKEAESPQKRDTAVMRRKNRRLQSRFKTQVGVL